MSVRARYFVTFLIKRLSNKKLFCSRPFKGALWKFCVVLEAGRYVMLADGLLLATAALCYRREAPRRDTREPA